VASTSRLLHWRMGGFCSVRISGKAPTHTTLSLVVALSEIGVASGLMKSAEAAPLVGGAMLTVILFPLAALRLTGQSVAKGTAHLGEKDGL